MNEEAKSYSQMRKEFHEKYKNEILPFVRSFEGERKAKLCLAIVVSAICSFLGGVLVCTSIFFMDPDGCAAEPVGKIGLCMFVLAWFSWYIIKKSFESSIKEEIMPKICSCYGKMKWIDGYHDGYSGNQCIFEDSYLVPDFTSEKYDDIFIGAYKDVAFEIVEARFQKGSGKHTTTVFQGVIVKLAMNKKFTSHTVIKSDTLFHISPTKELRRTELEDVVFEKKYDVFTNDEVDARYLITPTFMERLNKMKTAFFAESVTCAFYGDVLLIALSTTKDLFSLCSLVKSVDEPKQYFQMYEEIVSILKLIDHFKLGQKIGL